jgi:predicted nuclease of predicted toxin-antitoxin system
VRFLVDNSLSPVLAALKEFRVLISADSDFSRLLILGDLRQPSLIHLREGKPYEPAAQVELMQRHFTAIGSAVVRGSIVVFRHGQFRSRVSALTTTDEFIAVIFSPAILE